MDEDYPPVVCNISLSPDRLHSKNPKKEALGIIG